jgi:hypothetical protein
VQHLANQELHDHHTVEFLAELGCLTPKALTIVSPSRGQSHQGDLRFDRFLRHHMFLLMLPTECHFHKCRVVSESSLKGRGFASVSITAGAIEAYSDLRPSIEDMRAGGLSFGAIAKRLNTQGHTTRRGPPWNPVRTCCIGRYWRSFLCRPLR